MENKFIFVLESYKAYIDYYRHYIDGMWVRFNALLTIDLALAGVYGSTFTTSSLVTNRGIFLLPALGLMVSILLYIQSAQEGYIVARLRRRVDEIRQILQKETDSGEIPTFFLPLDDIDMGKRHFIFRSVVSWRSRHLSITRIPTITSMLFIVLWILAIFITP